jgi:outer membrane lipoprotein carrier protein
MRRLAAVLLACACLAAVPGARAEDATTRLERYLAGSGSLKAEFEQLQLGADGREQRRSSGLFYLRRPDRFRWEYLDPEPQLIVCDGRDIYVYEQDLEQVTIRSLATATGASPAMILARSNEVGELFTVEAAGTRDGLEWFRLAPRAKDPEFRGLEIGFAAGEISTMKFVDRLQQTTIVRFAALDRRAKLADVLFRFTPPKGVDVVGRPSGAR